VVVNKGEARMGTRHLICVKHQDEYKLIQYGQWDGYLSGQGKDVYDFLQNEFERETFIKNLNSMVTENIEDRVREEFNVERNISSEVLGC
jgi:hypothetical protein